ncbi:SRPBCC family protein [Streptomyces sp. NBC_01136]|uniref:type II toxin-antitoxin system RatA family toxin n=1 Tax=unclassified Streptomyces TaxID=2593676 RepID=UPI00325480E0|nr:SRPBCC family protein [Streptomyces sp. NBC_01136]
MPVVRTEVDIDDVSLEHVWNVMCDFEAHAGYMDDVLGIRFIEREADTALSSWRVLLNGSELTWDERDVFTPMRRIDFDQTEGDLEVFRGYWALEPTASGVRVVLEIEFDIGIPSLAAVLDPIGIQAIESNSRSMLAAIRDRRPAVVAP